MTAQSPFTGGLLKVAEAVPGNHEVVAWTPGESAESTVPTSSGPAAETTTLRGGREDLTVFFSIGVVVDVLLVTVFLVWAVGQWRKTRK